MTAIVLIVIGIAVLAALSAGGTKNRKRTDPGRQAVRVDHLHYDDPDVHRCSACGAEFYPAVMVCPRCGARFAAVEEHEEAFDEEMDEQEDWDEEEEWDGEEE